MNVENIQQIIKSYRAEYFDEIIPRMEKHYNGVSVNEMLQIGTEILKSISEVSINALNALNEDELLAWKKRKYDAEINLLIAQKGQVDQQTAVLKASELKEIIEGDSIAASVDDNRLINLSNGYIQLENIIANATNTTLEAVTSLTTANVGILGNYFDAGKNYEFNATFRKKYAEKIAEAIEKL